MGESYGGEVAKTKEELDETRGLLERCQNEKQLLQVDGMKKESEIRRMEKAMVVLRESLDESVAKMEIYAANATDLEAALKEKDADLSESLDKVPPAIEFAARDDGSLRRSADQRSRKGESGTEANDSDAANATRGPPSSTGGFLSRLPFVDGRRRKRQGRR